MAGTCGAREKCLEDTKEILTALITSNPLRCTMRQLCNDFVNTVGYSIPVKELGFRTVEDYLRSIPDVVNVYGCGTQAEVEGVVRAKSAHINMMVAKQKAPRLPSHKRQLLKRSSYVPARLQHYAPVIFSKPKPPTQTYNNDKPQRSNYVPHPKTQYSNQMKTQCSYESKPHYSNATQPQNSNWTRPQYPNETKVQYSNQTKPQYSNDTKPQYSNDTKPQYSKETKPQYSHETKPQYSSETKPQYSSETKPQYSSQTSPQYSNQTNRQFSNQTSPQYSNQTSPQYSNEPRPRYSNETNAKPHYSNETKPHYSNEPISTPDDSKSHSSEFHYDNVYPEESEALDYEYGEYESENDSSFEQSNERSESRSNEKDSCEDHSEESVRDKFSDVCSQFSQCAFEENSEHNNCLVPPQIQINLKRLISQHPEGILSTKLLEAYKEAYCKTLSFNSYNFRSVIEMCANLPNIFNYVQSSSDDYLVYDKDLPEPSLEKYKKQQSAQEEEYEVQRGGVDQLEPFDWCVSALVPPDVMNLCDSIPRYFPADLQVQQYLDLAIAEIYDVSKFWAYEQFGALEGLMKELQQFFGENSNRYLIPKLLLSEGLYCAVRYYGEYHRALILSLTQNKVGFVRVLCIDYGTVENVPNSELWFLPKKFGKVPSQALRCRLSMIRPPVEDSMWSTRAINKFRQMTTNKPLVANITSLDKEEQILDIYLADISDEENIFYVNDVLVSKGYAIFVDQVCEKGPAGHYKPIVPNLHLYPEFFEIESGFAPTTKEFNYLLSNKTPVHMYIPQYFELDFKEDFDVDMETPVAGCCDATLALIEEIEQYNPMELDYSPFDRDIVKDIRGMARIQRALLTNCDTSSDTTEDVQYEELEEDSESDVCSVVERVQIAPEDVQVEQEQTDANEEARGNTMEYRVNTNPFRNGCLNSDPDYVPLHPTNPFIDDLIKHRFEGAKSRNVFNHLHSDSKVKDVNKREVASTSQRDVNNAVRVLGPPPGFAARPSTSGMSSAGMYNFQYSNYYQFVPYNGNCMSSNVVTNHYWNPTCPYPPNYAVLPQGSSPFNFNPGMSPAYFSAFFRNN